MIIGNWKMHKTAKETKLFLDQLLKKEHIDADKVYLAVPFTAIHAASGYKIHLGAQNVCFESDGPYTGEISAAMVKEAGASFTLVGHSERRRLFGEDDEVVRKKLLRAQAAGLRVVLCVGETLEERSAGKEEEVLHRQLTKALSGLEASVGASLAIAYEPVWAIGTGKVATPAQAAKAHLFCYQILEKIFPGQKIPILYGGSVKADNLGELLKAPHIKGALVGGASLDAASYAALVRIGQNVL